MIRIPIKAIKEFAKKHNLSHVIVFAHSEIEKLDYVATYGVTIKGCDQAAQFGDVMKDALGWPKSLHAFPNRVKRLQDRVKELEAQIKAMEVQNERAF